LRLPTLPKEPKIFQNVKLCGTKFPNTKNQNYDLSGFLAFALFTLAEAA